MILAMDVIVTHENADFDAVAAQLAASKLYAEAVPILPRRLNRNVRDFLTLYGDSLPFVHHDERALHAVQRIIAVDCQTVPALKGSGGATAVHIIDHHPFDKPLPANATYEGAELGAATSWLVQKLMHAHVTLRRIEATLMLLGVFEDTGSLTYNGTRLEDFQAATWLFGQGADLDVVHVFLHQSLTDRQRELYQSLLYAAHAVDMAGYSIVIASVRAGAHVEEVSTLAHYLGDIFEDDALFVLVQMDAHVQLVARSLNDAIDVGAIAKALGGGGHARASAALIRAAAPEEVEHRLLAACRAIIHPRLNAGQVMSRSVRTLTPATTIAAADELMRRYGHEGFPVVAEGGVFVGLVTRRDIDRAVQHRLTDTPVSAYMHKGEVKVSPGEPLDRVHAIMIARGLGQVPVVDDGHLVGIVTRTDIIRRLGRTPSAESYSDIEARLEAALPEDVLILLRAAGTVASKKGFLLYAAGGFVRDLLLGLPNLDIDLVVEGNAIAMAKSMASRFGGHVHAHPRFGTAKWLLAGSSFISLQSLDFISARREYYTHPTALPVIENSSIQQDLHRRDFTINTLAICLDDRRFGQLLDFFGGVEDLRSGTVRVLHNLSFVEDPTRVLRAVRYEQRLNFHIEPRSEELVADALGLLRRVSGERITNELMLTLAEREPEKAIRRLASLGVLHAIHPDLAYDESLGAQFVRLRGALERTTPLDYLGTMIAPLPIETVLSIAQRLSLSKAQVEFLEHVNRGTRTLSQLAAADLPASHIVHLLEPFRIDALALIAALSDNSAVRERLARFCSEWRLVKPQLDGDSLRALGIPPGPIFREILANLRDARLDGALSSRSEEETLARALASRATTVPIATEVQT
jgi:tRNA nucleotidyltransferase (CCA-adding enzyme)